MPVTPVIIDPVGFSQQGPSGSVIGASVPNPFMFQKGGFLYEVLEDNVGPFANHRIGVWKSNLDGTGRVRMDTANQPATNIGSMAVNSRSDSTLLDIAFQAGTTTNVYTISFETASDTYGPQSPVSTFVPVGGLVGMNFQTYRRGADLYLVGGLQIGGFDRLVYAKLSAGAWAALVQILPPGNPNNADLMSLTLDESTGIVYMYINLVSQPWAGFILLDATDTPGTLRVLDASTGDAQYLIDTDRVDTRIIGGKLTSVWCDFDPITNNARANYLEATPLTDPTVFTATNIWTDSDPNPFSNFGAIALSNGQGWLIGTSAGTTTNPPNGFMGLLLTGVASAANGVTSAFWLRTLSPPSTPVTAQLYTSALVAGTWTAATLVYDYFANPVPGYTPLDFGGGALQRLQAFIGVAAPPPSPMGRIIPKFIKPRSELAE
jgi:hypothetical protein